MSVLATHHHHSGVSIFTSLTEALESAAFSGASYITVSLSMSRGRVTAIVYRKTFQVADQDNDEDTTSEMDVMTVLLRKYAKAQKRLGHAGALQFSVGGVAPTFIDTRLASWLEKRAGERETVPQALVQQIEEGTESVVIKVVTGTERRAELEALKVEDVRSRASALKVAGARRMRKAELIEAIIAAEQEAGGAS